MPRRFQFSLGRLLASISALCLAAAAFTNGLAQAQQLKNGWPLLIGWMVGWILVGVGISFLVNNRFVAALKSALARWHRVRRNHPTHSAADNDAVRQCLRAGVSGSGAYIVGIDHG